MKKRIVLLLVMTLLLPLLCISINASTNSANMITRIMVDSKDDLGGLSLTNDSMTIESAKSVIKKNVADGNIENLTISNGEIVSTKGKYSAEVIKHPVFIYAKDADKFKAILFDVDQNKYYQFDEEDTNYGNITYTLDDIYNSVGNYNFYVLGSITDVSTNITKVSSIVDKITLSNVYISEAKAKEITQNAVTATTMKTTDLLLYRYLGANVNSGQDQYKYLKYSGGNWVSEILTVPTGSTLESYITKQSSTYFVIGSITEKDYLSVVQSINTNIICNRETGDLTISKFSLPFTSVKEKDGNTYDLVCGYRIYSATSASLGQNTRYNVLNSFAFTEAVTQITENQVTIAKGSVTNNNNKLYLYVYSNHKASFDYYGYSLSGYPVYGTQVIYAPKVCTFNLNGGSIGGSTSDLSLYMLQGESLDKDSLGVSSDPSKNGNVFIGWYTEAVGGTKLTTVTADCTTYYAHYAKEITDEMLVYSAPGSLAYSGSAKTATVSLKEGVGDASGVSIAVKYYYDESCTSQLFSAPVDVGTYYVAVDITDSNNVYEPYTVRKVGSFTIVKSTPSAPTGLTAVAETISEKADGKITGLDSSMQYEYAMVNAAEKTIGNYTKVAKGSTEITGLASGDYVVRCAECANYNASPTTFLTVQSGSKITVTYDCNLEGYSFSPVIEDQTYDYGDLVTKPIDPTIQGYIFGGWYTTSKCETAWDFASDKLEGSGTTLALYAKWTAKKTLEVSDFTFTPPDSLGYDGAAKEASIIGPDGIGSITIKYYDGETLLSSPPTDAGTYTVKLSVAEGAECLATSTDLSSASWTFTINKKQLIVSNTSVDSKAYNDSISADVTIGTVDGKVGNDDVVVTASGIFKDKNAGQEKDVEVSYSLSGGKAANYLAPAQEVLQANISPAVLSVSKTTVENKMYDGSVIATAALGTVSGIYNGDDVRVSIDTALFDGKDAGDKTVTVTYKLEGQDADNYSISSTTCSAVITKREITLTSASATKSYDGIALTKNDVTVSGDGFIGNEGFESCGADGSLTEIGCCNNRIYYTFNNDTLPGNYVIKENPGTLSVTEPADAKYHVDMDSLQKATKAIQGKDSAITGLLFGISTDEKDINSEDVDLLKTQVTGDELLPIGVSISLATNYEYEQLNGFNSPEPINFSVDFDFAVYKNIQIARVYRETVDDAEKITYPELTVVNSEDLEAINLSELDEYVILDKENNKIIFNCRLFATYAISYDEKTPISITADSKEKIYDGRPLSSGATVADTAGTTITYQTKLTQDGEYGNPSSDVPGITDASTLYIRATAVNDGYLSASIEYVLTVNKKQLTISGTNAKDKTYDGTTAADITLGTLTGVAEGDKVDISVTGAFADKNAGAGKKIPVVYTISGEDSDNYISPVSENISADILKKSVNVQADDKTSSVGSELEELTFTSDSLVDGDSFIGLLTTSAIKDEAGTYDILRGTLNIDDGNGGENYSISYTSGKYTIFDEAEVDSADNSNNADEAKVDSADNSNNADETDIGNVDTNIEKSNNSWIWISFMSIGIILAVVILIIVFRKKNRNK